jgi:hypothetical protein
MNTQKTNPRDALRAKLLGKHKSKTKIVKLFGQEVEIRQPTLNSILSSQQTEDIRIRTVDMIIQYAYVPGTDELVFEKTDRDVILGWPFGEDIVELQNAIAEMTGVDVEAAEEELQLDPLKGQL